MPNSKAKRNRLSITYFCTRNFERIGIPDHNGKQIFPEETNLVLYRVKTTTIGLRIRGRISQQRNYNFNFYYNLRAWCNIPRSRCYLLFKPITNLYTCHRALVQISGRVGRSMDRPTGLLLFFHEGSTRSIEKAIAEIKTNE